MDSQINDGQRDKRDHRLKLKIKSNIHMAQRCPQDGLFLGPDNALSMWERGEEEGAPLSSPNVAVYPVRTIQVISS